MALPAALMLAAAATMSVHSARADDIHAYVASFGTTGVRTSCPKTNPCLYFPDALNAIQSGGTITCLDGGHDYGGFWYTTINKSVTIDCPGVNAYALGFRIDAPGHVVVLRNLTINGIGRFFDYSGPGIDLVRARALVVENCTIVHWFGHPGNNFGIRYAPSDPISFLVVSDTVFVNNGLDSAGAAIQVKPQPGGTARVSLERVNVSNGTFGIAADGTGSTGGINMTITDSVISGSSSDGIIAVTTTGGAPIGVMVKNTRSINNAIGIRSLGPNVTVRVDGSTIVGNATGLSFGNGGALLSAGNNIVEANGTNGAFSGAISFK